MTGCPHLFPGRPGIRGRFVRLPGPGSRPQPGTADPDPVGALPFGGRGRGERVPAATGYAASRCRCRQGGRADERQDQALHLGDGGGLHDRGVDDLLRGRDGSGAEGRLELGSQAQGAVSAGLRGEGVEGSLGGDDRGQLLGGNGADGVRRPNIFTRTARRLLVQMAPLPRLRREGRSEEFVWR